MGWFLLQDYLPPFQHKIKQLQEYSALINMEGQSLADEKDRRESNSHCLFPP